MLHYDDVTGLVSDSISIFPVIRLLVFMGSLPLFLRKVGLKLPELLLFFIGGSLLRGILSVGVNVEGGDGVYENGLGWDVDKTVWVGVEDLPPVNGGEFVSE